jgi:pantoate--beta-alanine ligase
LVHALRSDVAAERFDEAVVCWLASALKRRLAALIEEAPDARLDYIEFFETATLAPLGRVRRGARMALAVFLGETRLIDNGSL